MSRKTSIAKIATPVSGDILERERLYKLIDDERPLTWITGPGGSGKTTLTASYLRSRKIAHIWYRLDSGDGDIATFFHYMGLAAKKASPRTRRSLPHLTPEFMLGVPAFTRRFFEELCSRLKPPAVIVFDNYHEVPLESEFHNIMTQGLSVLPHGVRVIITSRANPPEFFSRLQLNRQMTVIGWETLCLDIKETAAVARIIKPDVMESHRPEVLHRKTGGWMAGLILMLETDHLTTMIPGEETPEAIFGYFATEIIYGLDEETRVFLLKTAVMPSMTLDMAKELTGVKRARSILSDLYRNNCFIEKRLKSPPVYQYHPLFRAFLLNESGEYFSGEEKNRLLRNAIDLLSRSGQVEDAAELIIETEDVEQLIMLILQNAKAFIDQGRSRVVEAWILTLPEQVREKNPWILFWLASCKMAYNMIDARSFFKQSFHIMDSQKDVAGTFLSWYGVAESILWGWDDFKSFDGWIDVLTGLVKKYDGIPEGEIDVRISRVIFSTMIQYYPDHPQFEFWKARALSLQETCPHIGGGISFLVLYSHYLQMCGKLNEADEVILLMKRLLQSKNPSYLEIMQARLVESVQSNINGDYNRCLEVAEKSLEISRRSGVHFVDAMIAGHALWSAFKREDIKRTDNYLKIMESSLSFSSPYDRSFYHFIKALFFLNEKNMFLAEKESRLSLEIALKIGVIVPLMPILSVRAYILHGLGKYEDASAALLQAIDNSRRYDKAGYIFEFSLLEAYFAFHREDERAALTALKTGLAQGRERGYKESFYFSLPEINRYLYTKALSAGIEVEYVQQLIRKGSLLPPVDMEPPENWPWPIKIYTLGAFRIEVNGKPLEEGRKSHHRLFNFLKVLICLGGYNVPSYRLADILWSGHDGDAAQSALDMCIHRLRKLLNAPGTIEVRHGTVSLNHNLCWVDALVFADRVKHFNTKKKDENFGANDMENMLSIYGGNLFPDLSDTEWVSPLRKKLRDSYLRILESLGNIHEKSKEWDHALDCYSRGVEHSPLSEEHVRGIMRTLMVLGRPAEAVKSYQKFAEELQNTMGIDPSPATKRLLKEIS